MLFWNVYLGRKEKTSITLDSITFTVKLHIAFVEETYFYFCKSDIDLRIMQVRLVP